MIFALVIAYAFAGCLIGCRIATYAAWALNANARQMYTAIKQNPTPDVGQWTGGAVLGLAAATVWPLALAAMMLRGILFRPPEHVRLEQQRQEIERLERELSPR